MKTLKSTVVYLLSNIIEKGIGFLLIPIYTHYLATEDYGMLTILQALIGINVILFSFSLNGAGSRYHFDGNRLYRKLHYGNLFASVIIISFLFSMILFLLKDFIFSFFGGIPIIPYFYLVIFISFGSIIFNLYQLKLQMEHRAIKYGINSITKFLFASVLSIYLVVFLDKKADGVLYGTSFALILFLIYIIYDLKSKIKLNMNKKLLRKNIKYSIYLIPHNLAGIAMQFMDRFFISNMINLSQAGVYALGGQISAILGIFSSAINTAITPSALKAYKDKDYKYLVDLANITIIFVSIIAMFLSLFSKEIITLISPKDYSNASIIISALSFYFVVQMYYFMTSSVLFYVEKATKFVAVATVLSLMFNLVLNYFLIPIWGILGASIATLMSIILVNYIVIFISQKYIIVGFEHLKIHFVILSAVILGNLNVFLEIGLRLKVLMIIIYLFLLFFITRNNTLLFELKEKLIEKINH